LGYEGNASQRQFSFEAFLIDRFEESATDFFVNIVNGSLNGVTFVLENQPAHVLMQEILSHGTIFARAASLRSRLGVGLSCIFRIQDHNGAGIPFCCFQSLS